jgi:2-phospho-L-lactate guanylyltransferase
MTLQPDLWAIIPVKPFGLGKSRLADVLDAQARMALNRQLFEHVFTVAIDTFGARRTIVVTADAALLATVSERGAHAIAEPAPGLNAALAQACRYAVECRARAVMVLPSDLPRIAATDIDALGAALGAGPCCVIAPDQPEQATNALVISPPEPDFFRFGPESCRAHLEAAAARGMTIAIVRRTGLAFDLDTPEDYRTFTRDT